MNPLLTKLKGSPVAVRVAPFLVFILLTACQGALGEASRYWFYLAKTFAGAAMLWAVWPLIDELRLAVSWEAIAAGVLVFLLWVGLDGLYPGLDELWRRITGQAGQPSELKLWNPHLQFGHNSALAWLFVFVRLAGSTLVVPPLEEVFYRSFLYRYIAQPAFETVPLGIFLLRPFLLTSLVFGCTHHEWLAGILCGFIYQGLVCRKKRLGDAIIAHGLTNLLLGLWVITRGAWKLW